MDGIFYTVIRQFIKLGQETHSMEIKTDLTAAQQRFFNIIASDLADQAISYNAAYIINSNGQMMEGRVFDRRQPEPESALGD